MKLTKLQIELIDFLRKKGKGVIILNSTKTVNK